MAKPLRHPRQRSLCLSISGQPRQIEKIFSLKAGLIAPSSGDIDEDINCARKGLGMEQTPRARRPGAQQLPLRRDERVAP